MGHRAAAWPDRGIPRDSLGNGGRREGGKPGATLESQEKGGGGEEMAEVRDSAFGR
jgi:hypothetical protein